MPTDDEILNLLIELEHISKERDINSVEGSSSGLDFLHNGSILTIHSYWATYEEGGNTDLKVNLETFEVHFQEDASTVYGSYDNDSIKKIKSLDEILEMI